MGDLLLRIAQWKSLNARTLTLASCSGAVWLGGLAMPDAFIAATKQAAALVRAWLFLLFVCRSQQQFCKCLGCNGS